jgi:outer membrane lipoprotein-sorting protein
VIRSVMMNQQRFVLCSVAAILAMGILSGCSSTRETTTDHSLSASDIITSVNAHADSIRTFSAYGTINIETPTMNQSAGFDLAVKKPDSVRIVVEGPFGITVAKALFTKERFIAYNALNNTVYEGDPSKGLQSLPMMSSIPAEVLIDAMSGVRRFTEPTTEPDSFYLTEKFYAIVISGKESTTTFRIDPGSMRISSVKTYASNRELLWEETYSYRQLENGQWSPSTARIFVPKKPITLDISFDEVTINGPIESMLITIPEDAERSAIQ